MSIAEQTDLWSTLARDRGAEAAAQASSDWMRMAEDCLADYIFDGTAFTADMVRDVCGPPPSANAMGALFLNASKAGLIQFVALERSSRIAGHRRRITVWRGTAEPGWA